MTFIIHGDAAIIMEITAVTSHVQYVLQGPRVLQVIWVQPAQLEQTEEPLGQRVPREQPFTRNRKLAHKCRCTKAFRVFM